MTSANPEMQPVRGPAHKELAIFLGDWHAHGMSFGGTDQSGPDPKANGIPWVSTHTARWHSGEFFVVQEECARLDGAEFDTHSILGVDPATGRHFARTFENHGFYRHYGLDVVYRTWQLTGPSERASTVFDTDGNTQTITWEWLREGKWLPLCDRVASRVDKTVVW
jgi:hypothetical protein